MLIAGP